MFYVAYYNRNQKLWGSSVTCEEMIYSEDYADYLINFLVGEEQAEEMYRNGCVNQVYEKTTVFHIPRPEDYLTNLERTPYSFIPKLFGLMDSSNLEAVGVKQIQNPNYIGLTGENVIIGFVDTGIDYTNPLFLDENGNTRVGVIWDQTITGTETSALLPKPFYGTAFSSEDINEALRTESPYEKVPSRDENGHGTFMAGVAAGGVNGENDFTGIATKAELAVVKLKETKQYLRDYFGVPDDVPAYEESDLIYAVDYLIRYASQRRLPISIFIGLGSSNGGHLGLTVLEQYLSSLLENLEIMISVAAGNEGNERLHYAGNIEEGMEFQQVDLNVDEGQQVLAIEFWGKSPATFSIGIISPQGDRIARIAPRFGQEELIWLPIAKSTVYVAYQLIETYSGEELIFVRLTNPTPGLWHF